MKWFMSYAYIYSGTRGEIALGSLTYADDEHPILKIKRWNDQEERISHPRRIHVLLSFQRLEPADGVPEIDVEIR